MDAWRLHELVSCGFKKAMLGSLGILCSSANFVAQHIASQVGPKTTSTWPESASTSLSMRHLGIEVGFDRKGGVLQCFWQFWNQPRSHIVSKWPVVGGRKKAYRSASPAQEWPPHG